MSLVHSDVVTVPTTVSALRILTVCFDRWNIPLVDTLCPLPRSDRSAVSECSWPLTEPWIPDQLLRDLLSGLVRNVNVINSADRENPGSLDQVLLIRTMMAV